ncbi:MAG: nuclear transport factor 2 family protein [Dehalococcoidia bacterium]|nr:nuclear transport factor 2 family protein [Dehalococcoidia bacterium]
MADPSNLEARIRALEDIEAIKQLKARYWRCLDKRLWDEFGTCFTDDATFDVGETPLGVRGAPIGSAEIVQYVKGRKERNSAMTFHLGQALEIVTMTDTEAKAIWRFHDSILTRPDALTTVTLKGGGFYEDEYVKAAGQWKIKSLKVTRLFTETSTRRDWLTEG